MLDDVLLVNCRILAVDEECDDRANALALRGSRILAVGAEDELRRMLAPGYRVVDGDASCLMPAFHDSHLHLAQHGFELEQVDLHSAATLDEGLARIAERASQLEPGAWVLGAGFALQRWQVATLDRSMLDRAAPRNPVLLRSQDHHSAWVNSRALAHAGVDYATSDPSNGKIVRDGNGQPTGMLLERALHLVWDQVPLPGQAEVARAVARAGTDLAARGIATVHHMAYEPARYWREVAGAASNEDFPVRVWACIDQENIERAAGIGLATGHGGGNFTVGGAKFFADGALGSRTAWMLEPYAGGENRGMPVHGPELLAERFPLAIAAGLAPVTHAIGDAAARAVIDALEATAPEWQPRGLRPRLEHGQHLAKAELARLASLGVTVSMQPIHLTFDMPSIAELLPGRAHRAYRAASLLAAGVPLAFGSDAPVAQPDVIAGLRAACQRQAPDGEVLCRGESLTPQQALRAYTRGAAWAIGREGRSGSLSPGFDADLVLLSTDPTISLEDLRVRGTIKGGRPTFDPEGLLDSGYTRS